jgi:glucosyl-3-phosphoglycerate phosphatase
LLIVRHGQSAWNAVGRWQGHADSPLSEVGERQAETAAKALGDVARVCSSDLRRARRTAEVIAGSLGLLPVEVHSALRERDVGAWSGLTNDEVDFEFPGYRAAGRTPPGWEDDAALLGRILPEIIAIGEVSPTNGVVVTHGGVLRALEDHLGAPRRDSAVENLGGRWITVEAGMLSIGPVVHLLGG